MPEFKLPEIDLEKAAADFQNAVKEAAYVAIGLGVLGFQRAQVQRVELMKLVESQVSSLSNLSTSLNTQFETYIKAAREQLAEAQAQAAKVIPTELPDAEAIRAQLTGLAKSVDEAFAPVRQQFEEQLDRLEEVLPEAAKGVVQTVRGNFATQEQAVRTAVGLV